MRLRTRSPSCAAANLVEPIRESIERGKPFLGVCLGLQLLFDTGYENGDTKAWACCAASACGSTYRAEYKVPHMGWNRAASRRRPPVFNGLADEPHFYFVHSYYVVPQDAGVIATETDYAGPFCSMVCATISSPRSSTPKKARPKASAS